MALWHCGRVVGVLVVVLVVVAVVVLILLMFFRDVTSDGMFVAWWPYAATRPGRLSTKLKGGYL
jgi:hypothetical protein